MAAEDETIVSEMVFPALTNHYGTFFAGETLKLMSKAAFIAASRAARATVVMASVDRTEFREPIRQGLLAECVARVTARGTTSLTVSADLFSEDFLSGERRLCSVATFTMVIVGGDGRPAPRSAP